MRGAERLFPFTIELKHSDFASHFEMGDALISAGFINPLTKQCYGESMSLNLASRPDEDTKLVEELFL